MDIYLYNNKSDNRVLNKNIDEVIKTKFVDKDIISFINPTIRLGREGLRPDSRILSKLSKVNYCYIPEFNRYYYCDVTIDDGGMFTLNCSVDVLMSYREEINKLTCLVARQENKNSLYINDEQFPMRCERFYSHRRIGTLPTSTGCNISLTVTGGM